MAIVQGKALIGTYFLLQFSNLVYSARIQLVRNINVLSLIHRVSMQLLFI